MAGVAERQRGGGGAFHSSETISFRRRRRRRRRSGCVRTGPEKMKEKKRRRRRLPNLILGIVFRKTKSFCQNAVGHRSNALLYLTLCSRLQGLPGKYAAHNHEGGESKAENKKAKGGG